MRDRSAAAVGGANDLVMRTASVAKAWSLVESLSPEEQSYLQSLAMAILGFLIFGSLIFWLAEEDLSIVDAFYFTGVSLSTVGYGDIAPADNVSRTIVAVYSLCGLGLFGVAMNEAARVRALLGVKHPVALSATLFISCEALGVMLFTSVEGMSVPDALWFSFVTSTSVGYGDLSVSTDFGKIAVVFYSIITLGPMAFVTGQIGFAMQSALGVHRREEEASPSTALPEGAGGSSKKT